jgi:hypothetical protein
MLGYRHSLTPSKQHAALACVSKVRASWKQAPFVIYVTAADSHRSGREPNDAAAASNVLAADTAQKLQPLLLQAAST